MEDTNKIMEEENTSIISDTKEKQPLQTPSEECSDNKLNIKPEDHEATETTPETNYDSKNVHYEGDDAIYTDPTSKCQYKWNKEKNEWEHFTSTKTEYEYGFEDDTHTYTDKEGVKFFWDKEKNAWFPKITDDFMAQYQLNYGFVDNTNLKINVPVVKPENDQPKPKKKDLPKLLPGQKRKASEPTWFELDESKNTKVYVSNLPLDITEEEYVELMQKYGIIMRDTTTDQLKIKLYRDPESNNVKGDALCTYIKRESVNLVLKLLDGLEYRGKTIKVELAKFQMKGTYDPKLKPKTKKRKEKEKLKRQQEKLFDWRPEKQVGERGKHERCIILRNCFESKMFDEDVSLILTMQDELRSLASQYGAVRKVIIYDRHPEGVAQINMKEPEDADQAVVKLNNIIYRGRKVTSEIWDGRTKFKIAETDSEINQRLEKWDEFLEADRKSVV